MIETKIELIEVQASDGFVLTNGVVYSKKIYLGINDSITNWYEITDEAYAEYLAEQEARILESR